MTHDEMIAVIEHHKKGGRLEMRIKYNIDGRPGEWKDARPVCIKWDFDTFDFRIKPEPVVRWAIEWEHDYFSFYHSKKDAEEVFKEGTGAVRMFKMNEIQDD